MLPAAAAFLNMPAVAAGSSIMPWLTPVLLGLGAASQAKSLLGGGQQTPPAPPMVGGLAENTTGPINPFQANKPPAQYNTGYQPPITPLINNYLSLLGGSKGGF